MKVCVIGTGYVGLVTGACLANVGHVVACVDNDERRLESLKSGAIPFYEPGLSDIVKNCVDMGNLEFFGKLSDALKKETEICFIAVGTPQADDGSAELKYVEAAARDIGRCVNGDLVVVNKSTVPVGTAERVLAWVAEELPARNKNYRISVVSNPEFLREGSAVENFVRPDRIILGSDDESAIETMRELYSPYNKKSDRIIIMDAKSSEMSKYAANAMLASRISFMNELANICERVGANIDKIRLGIGADERIGRSFLYAGCGFGGSCFPKDVSALINIAKTSGGEPHLLEAVKRTNDRQKKVVAQKAVEHFGGNLSGITFAVWGLSFKPNTDDIREAPALEFIDEVIGRGAKVRAFDPKALENAREHYADTSGIEFFSAKYETLICADALVLMTEWNEFKNPDLDELALQLKAKAVFDGRNIYSRRQMEKYGLRLYQIGM